MPLDVVVVMDPIGSINVAKDSTFAMLLAAQRRGHRLHYVVPGGLSLTDGVAHGRMASLSVRDDPENWHELGPQSRRAFGPGDVILMRRDPPVDAEYVYDTQVLGLAQAAGARVVNDPRGLRDLNEKLAALEFPQCCPPTLVSRSAAELKKFVAEQGEAVLKPLDGMGGRSIFRTRTGDPNLAVILETLTDNGRRMAMAQRYLPEIVDGDKRILVIAGEPVPHSLARIPLAGETRGNLAAGGRGVAQPLTERDLEIARAVGARLAGRGLLLIGLDVIGDYLTEVNVTSPTCFVEITEQTGFDVGERFAVALEKAVGV